MPEYYAIVVDVPNPELKCFIAFPFSLKAPTYDYPITLVIDQAVRQAKLDPCWVDWKSMGTSIMESLALDIRGACMVIAVCTPEEATNKSNPNVTYELGLADAIGKPTLMMTTDIKALPFDVGSKMAFPYSQDELKGPVARGELQLRLKDAILSVRNQTEDPPLILKNPQNNIWIVRAEDRLVLTEHFWSYVKSIFEFADKLRKERHPLGGTLAKLFDVAAHFERTYSFGDFLTVWNDWDTAHYSRILPILDLWESSEIKAFLEALKKHAFGADNIISSLETDYNSLNVYIREYKRAFETASQGVQFVLNDGQQTNKLLAPVTALKRSFENLTGFAEELITRLTRTINDAFYMPAAAVTPSLKTHKIAV